MPIYEYKCDQCSHELETLQKINDSPETICPACGKTALRKRISAVAFQLKGTGWYETDFKNKKPEGKKAEKKSKSDSSKAMKASDDNTPSKKTDGKTDSSSQPAKSSENKATSSNNGARSESHT